MSSTDEPRLRNRHIAIAVTVALPVGLAAAVATFATGSWAGAAAIAAPALAALLVAPLLTHRLVSVPLRRSGRATEDRLIQADRHLADERRQRTVLRELDRALDQAATEPDAIEIIRAAFNRHLGGWPLELHLVDVTDPVLTMVVASGDHEVQVPRRTSPWDALAARTNTTLVYDTTDRLDVCSHLKSRVANPMAAVAVPLNAADRLLGVLYRLSPEGQQPTQADVDYLGDIAAVIAARVAVLRSVTGGSRADAIDRLTGLPDRSAMQERLLRLLQDRQSFSVAVADIDRFGKLNETLGRDAGDSALKILARVARRTVRPEDMVGRIGGDELVFVLPRTRPDDATRALERLREELVLTQSAGEGPPFTLSVGVIGSSPGASIEEILHLVGQALKHAKSQGGNRVVVAQPAEPATSD